MTRVGEVHQHDSGDRCMTRVGEVRESIREKVAAMDYDLRTLELREKAEAQGIDLSGGGRFGLDTLMFTPAQRREWHCFRTASLYVKRQVRIV